MPTWKRPDPLRASVIALAHGGFRRGEALAETAHYGPGYEIISEPDAMTLRLKVPGRNRGDHPRFFTVTIREVSA